MNNLFILLLLTITFNVTSSQLLNFKLALNNALDQVCLLRNSHLMQAARANCTRSIFDNKLNISDQIRYFCNTNIHSECIEKIKSVFALCLPKSTHSILTQIFNMDKQELKSLCMNNGKHYTAIMASSCNSAKLMFRKLDECEAEVRKRSSKVHLQDYFSLQNCLKYKEYYDCNKAIHVGCPDLENAANDVSDARAHVTPCKI